VSFVSGLKSSQKAPIFLEAAIFFWRFDDFFVEVLDRKYYFRIEYITPPFGAALDIVIP
jgi:hypothetical protein